MLRFKYHYIITHRYESNQGPRLWENSEHVKKEKLSRLFGEDL